MSALLETAAKLCDDRQVTPAATRATMAAIEAARVEAVLSIEALAGLAGISERSYRRYERGDRIPRAAELRRLARAVALGEAQRQRDDGLMRALAVAMLEELARRSGAPTPRDTAIYLAHVELRWPQRQIAKLFGVSSNRVHFIVRRVEERRDEGTALDRGLLQLGDLLERGAEGFIGRSA